MKTICITILGVILSISVFSQISYDTTASREWNDRTNKWESFDRVITTNNNGQTVSELVQIMENDKWVNYNFISYYYNNGLVIEEFEQYWNDSELKWQDNYRKLYSYDNNSKLVQITHQNIFQGKYVNSSREIMIYTPEGKLKEKIIQKFEEAWTNFLRYQYYYNASDLLMDENLAYWNEETWDETSFVYNYSYDNNRNLTEKIKKQISGNKEKYITKEVLFFGDNGRIEEHIISTWNSGKKTWIDKNRALYANNMNGYIISMLSQNTKKKQWVNYLFTDFSGSRVTPTGIAMADGMTFSIYPTQFGKKATIEFTNPYNELYDIRVINEKGQLIGSATTDKDEISIDARNLNKGLYFVELQGSNLYSGKFSIE